MEIQVGDQVSLIIGVETHLGFTVLINESQEGLLYKNEVFQPLEEGQRITGYIKHLREDGKIDVSLQPQGFRNVIDKDTDTLLQLLRKQAGFIQLTDKSSPEDIKTAAKMSKKAFKRALGALYKQKMVTIAEDGIRLVKK